MLTNWGVNDNLLQKESTFVRDSLDRLFIANQFHRINSNVPYIKLYIQYGDDFVSVVQLLDFNKMHPVTTEEYDAYKANAISYIKKQGHGNIDFLTIVLTDNPDECRSYVIIDDSVWLIDTDYNRLLIYETQISDFCNLRGGVENICLDKGGSIPATYYQQVEPIKKRNFWQREFTVVNSLLVLINIGFFIYLSSIGSTLDIDFMLEHGVMFVPRIVEDGEYFRLLTCMFMHFGFQHLVGNMVVLMFLGDNVERNIGWFKYLILYFGSGLIGSTGSFIYASKVNPAIVSAGASGAIYGVIGALLWLLIRNRGRLEEMTIIRVIVLVAYMLFSGFTSENIDMAAHLCGFAGGVLLAMILYRKEKSINEN